MAITYQGAANFANTTSDYFLQVYDNSSKDIYDSTFPYLSMVKKTHNHVGNQFEALFSLSLAGGTGSGVLPEPTQHQTKRVKIGRKSMYYRQKVDRQTLMAGVGDGVFEDMAALMAKRGPLSFSWNMERAMWAPHAIDGSSNVVGSGKLGTITAVSGTNPYTLTIANDWLTARYEVGSLVNIKTGNTAQFEIQSILPDSTQITVERIGGSQVPAGTDEIFMQGSEDNDPIGVYGAAELASGESIYTQAHAWRWQPTRLNANSAGITTELIDELVHGMVDMAGREAAPTHLWCHSTQWRKIAAQMEDTKDIQMIPPRRKVEGVLGFSSLSYKHPYGEAPIMVSNFIPKDDLIAIRMSKAEIMHAPGFGWMKDTAGTIWFPYQEEDALQGRYGGYMEHVLPPAYVAQLHTLAT